jgi:chromosome segregation ATPase
VGGATGAVSGLGDAAAGTSARTQKSIEELNEEIRGLEEQKQKSFDPAEITAFNRQIETLKEEVNRLNSLGTKTATTTVTATTEVTGRIGELTDQIRQLEDAKARAYDVKDIAEYNDKIAELRRELESLNSITVSALEVPQPVLTGNLAELSLPAPKLSLPSIDLKPLASRAAEQMRAIREYLKTELFGWAGSINEGLPQRERLIKLNQIAIQQMRVLAEVKGRKILK